MLSASLNKTFPSFLQMQHIHHENITEFIGVVLEPNNNYIITEYCTKGSLQVTLTQTIAHRQQGAGRCSEVERSLMVRWVVGSILYRVDPLSYFSFHDWCNKGRGMCYPVCGMVHIKEPLLLIDKSSLCGGSRFPFSLSEWSLIICLTPYNRG